MMTAIFFERRISLRNDQQPLDEKSRSQQRSKRRKTNIILNSLNCHCLIVNRDCISKYFFWK